jgi:CheY-like chemotaxis protein
LSQSSFPYRILIVDDHPVIREAGKILLETQGYDVITAGDGFEALLALKRALPDVIISDLSMPNMSGFEFLSVVRRRFPHIPVIVLSAEFTGMGCPESVLTDAYFAKGQYTPEVLFSKVLELIHELPSRPRAGKPMKAAVWVKNDRGSVAVTCTDCLRTFPVAGTIQGVNSIACEFCPCTIRFEVIGDRVV